MGGKTETYTDVGGQPVFSENDNLFTKDLIRHYGKFKGINGYQFGKNAITNMTNYFSVAKLEALGVTAQVEGDVRSVNLQSIIKYIRQTDTSTHVVPFSYDTLNYDESYINDDYYRAKLFFESNYFVETAVVAPFNVSAQFVTNKELYEERFCARLTNHLVSPHDIHYAIYSSSTVSVSYDFDTYLYKENDTDTDAWLISTVNGVMVDLIGYTQNDEGDWEENGNTQTIEIAEDKRIIYYVKYAQRDDDYFTCPDIIDSSGWNIITEPILREDVVLNISKAKFLIMPIKAQGRLVETERYQKALMSDWGFDPDDLTDSVSDPNTRDAFLTFATKYSDVHPFLQPLMDKHYGDINALHGIFITTEDYTIAYTPVSSGGSYIIEINNFLKSAKADDFLFLIPIESIIDATLIEKYEILQKHFGLVGTASTTIKLKWYQTGFFKFVLVIITVTIAIITGQPELIAWMVGLDLIGHVVASIFGEKAAAIVMAVLAVVTAGYSLISGAEYTVYNIAKFSLVMGKSYFKISSVYQVEKYQKRINYYEQQEENIRKQLEELKSYSFYSPLDSYSVYYDTLYNYDIAYTRPDPYANLYNFNRRLRR